MLASTATGATPTDARSALIWVRKYCSSLDCALTGEASVAIGRIVATITTKIPATTICLLRVRTVNSVDSLRPGPVVRGFRRTNPTAVDLSRSARSDQGDDALSGWC